MRLVMMLVLLVLTHVAVAAELLRSAGTNLIYSSLVYSPRAEG